MRFRRISFPISALLSIVAIFLFFHPGLNLGIDFRGGTLIELQTKDGPADLAKMRTTLTALEPRRYPVAVVRRAERRADPRRAAAGRRAGAAGRRSNKVKQALGGQIEYRRIEVVGPRVSSELLSYGTLGIIIGNRCDPDLSLVPLRVAVRARRHDRERARSRADARLHGDDAGRLRPDLDRGAAHYSGLFAQRYGCHLRPYPRDAAALQEAADDRPARTSRSTRRCRARSSRT